MSQNDVLRDIGEQWKKKFEEEDREWEKTREMLLNPAPVPAPGGTVKVTRFPEHLKKPSRFSVFERVVHERSVCKDCNAHLDVRNDMVEDIQSSGGLGFFCAPCKELSDKILTYRPT